MANPSSPSRAPRNAPQAKVHRYVDALFTDDFGRQSKLTTYSANSFAKKKLDAAAQSLQLKGERREKQVRRIEIREWRAAERSIAAEMRESDHRIRLMWRSLNTKVRPEKKVRRTPPRERKRHWPYAAVALPKYDGPVIDRQGQRGVFLRMRYYSRRTAEQGVSQRVVKYCFNGAELDTDGNPYVATNVGATIDEALCGFDHLEQVNWSAAKNAKLLMHGILAVDHRQSPDEMMTCGLRWAEETLARFDLPYLVTLHAPPPDGDQRNWHLHILWSFRPMVRTGDHQWQVAEMLRTDLDNPTVMKVFREMFAAVMTDMSFEAGQNQVWTAKSNADRGLSDEPEVHLGAAKTNQARNGEHVSENEENHERVQRSKAAVLDDDLRHADEALAKQQVVARAFATRWARLSSLPMRVPERVMAATIAVSLPNIRTLPARSSAVVFIPARPPELRAKPAPIAGSLATLAKLPLLAMGNDVIAIAPVQPARPARIEIANLRFPPRPLAKEAMDLSVVAPVPPARTALISTLPSMPIIARRGSITIARLKPPPLHARPAIPSVPVLSSMVARSSTFALSIERVPKAAAAPSTIRTIIPIQPPPPALADPGAIERAFHLLDHALGMDKARRKREREIVERAARDAQSAKDQQEALERLLLALEDERYHLALEQGRLTVEGQLLARFELSADAINADAVQTRLDTIADRNAGELSRIQDYVAKQRDQLRDDGDHWTLRETAPPDVRALVSAWRSDRTVQAALARAAGAVPVASATPHRPKDAARPQTAWQRARHLREKAMAEWDVAERRNRSNVIRPGTGRARAGENRTIDRADDVRHFKGMPGPERGD